MGGDVGDALGGEHRRGAVGKSGEGHGNHIHVLHVIGAVGAHLESIFGVGGEAGEVEACAVDICGTCNNIVIVVKDAVSLAVGIARVARPADSSAVGCQAGGHGCSRLEAGGSRSYSDVVNKNCATAVVCITEKLQYDCLSNKIGQRYCRCGEFTRIGI